jgi:hypothetical protein
MNEQKLEVKSRDVEEREGRCKGRSEAESRFYSINVKKNGEIQESAVEE